MTRMTDHDPPLSWAKVYRKMGLSVIPLNARMKLPSIQAWEEFRDRQLNNNEIKARGMGDCSGTAVSIDLGSRDSAHIRDDNEDDGDEIPR